MANTNHTKLILPAELVPDGSKLKNGEEMNRAKVGAFYGSSLEWGVTAQLQYCNGKSLIAPADTELMQALKPKRVKGQFGALKEETTIISKKDLHLGKSVFELTDKEIIADLANKAEKVCSADFVTKTLQYVDSHGTSLSYEQLMNKFALSKEANARIQAEKDELIQKFGCQRSFRDGKWSSPEYPEELLKGLELLNNNVVAATGVNLIVTVSGVHTIAKDSNFFGGTMTQEQLDRLSSIYNYKECKTFYKGSLRRNKVIIPVQSVKQLKSIMSMFNTSTIGLAEWPDQMKKTAIHLVQDSK